MVSCNPKTLPPKNASADMYVHGELHRRTQVALLGKIDTYHVGGCEEGAKRGCKDRGAGVDLACEGAENEGGGECCSSDRHVDSGGKAQAGDNRGHGREQVDERASEGGTGGEERKDETTTVSTGHGKGNGKQLGAADNDGGEEVGDLEPNSSRRRPDVLQGRGRRAGGNGLELELTPKHGLREQAAENNNTDGAEEGTVDRARDDALLGQELHDAKMDLGEKEGHERTHETDGGAKSDRTRSRRAESACGDGPDRADRESGEATEDDEADGTGEDGL